MGKIEKVKAALAEEIRWMKHEQRYGIVLEGKNLAAHIRAARKHQRKANAKFRRLINGS